VSILGKVKLGTVRLGVLLDVAGLLLLAVAAGMVFLAAGVALAGVGCLVLAWRYGP
jgi:hypothetical protein